MYAAGSIPGMYQDGAQTPHSFAFSQKPQPLRFEDMAEPWDATPPSQARQSFWKRHKRLIWILALLLVLACIGAVVGGVLGSRSHDQSSTALDTSSSSVAAAGATTSSSAEATTSVTTRLTTLTTRSNTPVVSTEVSTVVTTESPPSTTTQSITSVTTESGTTVVTTLTTTQSPAPARYVLIYLCLILFKIYP